MDATVVSALHCDGSHTEEEGICKKNRRKKERKSQELVGLSKKGRLLVIGVEVGSYVH